jgi:hypothetical protein
MAVKKEKPPVKYYEIVDKKPSGFIMDGTGGTPYQQELTAPSIQWVSAQAKTCIKTKNDQGVETKHYVEIRYINGCDSIIPEEQEKRGFFPKRLMDKIPIENGFVTVERDGNTIGLYDYLEKAFWNQDNPDRPETANARYREVKMDKKAEVLLDEDQLMTEAKSIVYSLRVNTGNKNTPYRYNEDRIDTICKLVNVWDQSPETKLVKLLKVAIQTPRDFLEIVTKSEQTIITEISHALEMNVINFDGNTAQFSEGNKVLKALGSGNMRADAKIEKLGEWLGTDEGNPSLTELRAKLELAKEKEFGSPK